MGGIRQEQIKWKKQIMNICVIMVIIGMVSLVVSIISLYYSTGNYGVELFWSYLRYKKLIFLHFLPVFCVSIILFFITNRLDVSCGCTSVLVLGLTWVNYFKLQLRDDPFLFSDFLIVSEAKNMMGDYKISLTADMFVCILLVVLLVVTLHFINRKIIVKWLRGVLLAISVLISAIFYNTIYCNAELYESIHNYDLVSQWGDTQRFVSRGFLYPFIYSTQSAFPDKPEGYNMKDMEECLEEYEYTDIPEAKKVNVIGIMLEAYSDFSKYEELEFENNPYEEFYKIREEAYYGQLTTNIFAGGTINTERGFLTGYRNIPSMRGNTNTYVQYFEEQGYETLGRHQCYGWFYNRKNINRNMGFSDYLFYEEGYSEYDMNYLVRNGDSILVEDIISDYEKVIQEGKKCFHFSVSYQNHGPYYAGEGYEGTYLKWQSGYDEESFAIANNYFNGIAKTGKELASMIDYFEKREEPVVVILFGDHNPWMGDNNSIYEMLGINLDLDTEDGFYNYYNTPYLIWGNKSAEKVLDVRFEGEGANISPCFLMTELFKVLGYTGNEYMQYTSKLYREIPVLHSNAYIEKGDFVRELSPEGKLYLDEFNKLQYYWIYDNK